jgi:chromosome segregation ATPase
MTESIQRKIEQIESKVFGLHDLLQEQRAEKARLQSELEGVNARLLAAISDLASKSEELNAVQVMLSSENEQKTVSSTPVVQYKEQEIDELVKEIEYCISQLKK